VIVPQSGIFAVGTSAHCFLEFTCHDGISAAELVHALADLEAPHTTVGGTNLVIGVRPSRWEQLRPDAMPAGVHDFDDPIVGIEGFSMPATQCDGWVWVAGAARDGVFDVSKAVIAAMAPVAGVTTEATGWAYQHSRDLIDFEDGTENPSLSEAPEIVLVPAGQPGEGSSVLLFQQWSHDAAAWTALSDEQQEKVVGRTKDGSIELDDATQAPDSHVSRTVIENDEGVELDIFRRNVPYGTVTDYGTMFIGFSFEPERMTRMLRRMAGTEGGVRDALTRYTTPLTGAYYVIPEVGSLAAFATPEDDS
jgi:porphyrinogen peroxidase